ncbi:unnamed protein product [Cylindrotheca closterium]|uniref:Uncharacterized protein n=1 Tax=Cylindrotheca closterium TaxID=2856 RepID=A0AAD2PXZ0_9STRA|nr:unnamed protein product [Cylindrotheca closterium]
MDTALLVASASLSVYIPGCRMSNLHHQRSELISKCIAIALCLGLFSLTILEAVPDSLLTWLSTDHETASVWSIAHAYWILLWCLVILILVVLPSLMGISLAYTLSTSFRYYFFTTASSTGGGEKDPFGLDRCCPWWLKLILHMIKGIFRRFFRLLCRGVATFCPSRRPSSKRSSNVILPMTMTSNNKSSESLASLTGDNNRSLPVVNTTITTTTTAASIGATLLGGLGGILVALLALRTLGPLVVQPTLDDHNALPLAVSWLCGWGLLVSSILNGFGSVSMPHASLTGLYLKPVPPEVIAKLQAERESVRQTLESKRQSLKEVNVTIPSATSSGNVFSPKTTKTTFSNMGDELSNRRNILQTEIDFLENLCHEMAEDIDELKYTQIQAAAARTTMGRIRFSVGVVFSIILLIRLFSAALNIWRSYTQNMDRQKHSQPDLVTSILALLLGHNLVSSEKITMLSQVISLALTAFLSFSQVRTFVKTMHVVNRKLNGFCSNVVCSTNRRTTKQQQLEEQKSRSHHAEQNGALSLYGGAMGYLAILTGCCYTLTCIVSIKTMLPDEYCVGFAKALGGSMDVFTIHTAMVNEVFATSAAISASVLGVLFGIQRDNNFRHTSTSTSSSSSKAITMNGTSSTTSSTNKYRGAEAC